MRVDGSSSKAACSATEGSLRPATKEEVPSHIESRSDSARVPVARWSVAVSSEIRRSGLTTGAKKAEASSRVLPWCQCRAALTAARLATSDG